MQALFLTLSLYSGVYSGVLWWVFSKGNDDYVSKALIFTIVTVVLFAASFIMKVADEQISKIPVRIRTNRERK